MNRISKYTLGMYAGLLTLVSPVGYIITSEINHPPIISRELNKIQLELDNFYNFRGLSKMRPSELDSIFEMGKNLMIKRDSLMSLPQYKSERIMEKREIGLSALLMLAGAAVTIGSVLSMKPVYETRKDRKRE